MYWDRLNAMSRPNIQPERRRIGLLLRTRHGHPFLPIVIYRYAKPWRIWTVKRRSHSGDRRQFRGTRNSLRKNERGTGSQLSSYSIDVSASDPPKTMAIVTVYSWFSFGLSARTAASPVISATYPSLQNSIKINSLVGTRVLLSVTDNPTGEGWGKKLKAKKGKGERRWIQKGNERERKKGEGRQTRRRRTRVIRVKATPWYQIPLRGSF